MGQDCSSPCKAWSVILPSFFNHRPKPLKHGGNEEAEGNGLTAGEASNVVQARVEPLPLMTMIKSDSR